MQRILVQILKNGSLAALVGGGLALSSCASSSSSPGAGEAFPEQVIALGEGEGAMALDRKYAMQKGDVEYDEHGGVSGGKRSQYEGQKQVQFGGEWAGKTYDKKQYEKRSWWGGKKVETKQYAGNMDGSRFQTASAYGSQNANADGQRSRFDGRQARTATYRVDAATEAGVSGVAKPSNAQADWRRDVYPKPHIMGYRDYQEKSISETRSLLGRDD
ncbi:MAG: hypothetical protein O3A87_05420 [Verrucomicrobia bacterium]|nr:hypothetical protein [Verrucomicrobiota bacterium]MDA1005906.1 hypothetical protein [Verrucomicrobiota bacterium]